MYKSLISCLCLATLFISSLLGQTPLSWIGQPTDHYPSGSIDLSLQDCTNDFDPCVWMDNNMNVWEWAAIEGIVWEGGCDVSVEYSHLPCQEAIDIIGLSDLLINPEENTLTSTQVCITLRDNCNADQLQHCFTVALSCGICAQSDLPFCGTCQDAALPFPMGCLICDSVELQNGFSSCMPACEPPCQIIDDGSQPSPLCNDAGNVPHNMSWFAFVASSEHLDIIVDLNECTIGQGVQLGIYDSCDFDECVIWSGGCEENAINISTTFNPGQTYYLFLDGCNGDACSYDISIFGDQNTTLPEADAITAFSLCKNTFLTDDPLDPSMPNNASLSGLCYANDIITACAGEELQFNVIHQGIANSNITEHETPCSNYSEEIDLTYIWQSWEGQIINNPFLDEAFPILTTPDSTGIYQICLQAIFADCAVIQGTGCLNIEVVDDLTVTYYVDSDNDGFGTGQAFTGDCIIPDGFACVAGDCDDTNPLIYPGAEEICDGLDNDCDSATIDGMINIQPLILSCEDITSSSVFVTWTPLSNVFHEIYIDGIFFTAMEDNNFRISDLEADNEVTITIITTYENGCTETSEITCRTASTSCSEIFITPFRPSHPNENPEGPYFPGEIVNFNLEVFFTADPAGSGNDCQWLQGLIPTFGEGWDLDAIDPFASSPDESIYFAEGEVFLNIPRTNTRIITNARGDTELEFANALSLPAGTALPQGWWYTSPGAPPCENNGNPNTMWGFPQACASEFFFEYAFNLQVKSDVDPSSCQDFGFLEIAVFAFSDGLTGCRPNDSCANEQPGIFSSTVDCSNVPTATIFDKYSFLATEVDTNNCAGTIINVYNIGAFSLIHVVTPDSGVLYAGDGSLFCTDSDNFSCLDFYDLDTPTDSFECEDGPGPGPGTQPDIATDFPWISDVIDFSNCDGTIVELYQFGSQVFPYIITDDSAVLYSNTGQLYCTSALPNFDCIAIYGLSAPIDTWRCDGGIGPDPLPGIFEDYPFLADILDPADCDANVTVYQMGNFVALFIESNGEVTMYNSDGLFYCQDGPNFSCLTTYGFTSDDIIDEWSCSGFDKELIDTRSNEAQIDSPVLYPNPSNGIVYLKGLPDSESHAYRLYDRQGANVMTGQISNGGHIDISELASSIYIMGIIIGEEVTALKLIRM